LKIGIVSAEGDLDFVARCGVDKEAPVGFAEIRLRFDVDTPAPQDKLDLLLKLTERYCVVYQTIRNGPKVSVTMQRCVISYRGNVVPANAGTHTPCPLAFSNAVRRLFSPHEQQWLGSLLFAGTTKRRKCPPTSLHLDAGAAHGGGSDVRGDGICHRRAVGPGYRRIGGDAADIGWPLLSVSRTRPRRRVHREGALASLPVNAATVSLG